MERKPVMPDEEPKSADTEDEEMEDEEKACSKKSVDLTEDDLMKSISKLESFMDQEDPNARKNELLNKAQTTDLDKSEQEELFSLISGSTSEEIVSDSITKGFRDNEVIQKSMDVSDFLAEQTTELSKALSEVEDRIEKGTKSQNEFNLVLAKALSSVGKAVKSIEDKIDVIGNQPVRKPTSTQPLNKSFAGKGSNDEAQKLSKGEVLNRLTTIIEDRMAKGMPLVTDFGADLTNAIAKFEMTGALDPRVYKLVAGPAIN